MFNNTTRRIFRKLGAGVIAWVFLTLAVFSADAAEQAAPERLLTIHLDGVFDAKVSYYPLRG